MTLTLTRATKIVPLCLRLDLKAEHDRAQIALTEARNAAAQDARETSTAVRDAAAAVVALEEQMKDHTVLVTLQAVPRKTWNEFVAAHPPREGNDTDKVVDVDVSALDEVLVKAIVKVESHTGDVVPFTPSTDWEPLADEMSDSQWTEFATAVLALNNGSTTVPFSPAASLAMRRSEPSSKQPTSSGSRSSGSTAGSRAPSTSTTAKGA